MEDFISRLPDDILISIISRISLKEAVRTSTLSKSWRNLYKFIPTVNFFCRDLVEIPAYIPGQSGLYTLPPHDSKVIDVVHRFLQLHSGSISSFGCEFCSSKPYEHIIEECIYSLGNLGVENLSLSFSCSSQRSALSFSCHLLSHMPSLKYLTLSSCLLKPNLKTGCNSLKTLSLSQVRIPPVSLECTLSNCLSLYSMRIDMCEYPSKLHFCGPNLQLKSLVIHICEAVEEIKFYTSNLMTFEFYNSHMVKFIFDYVPQLQSIYLSVYEENVMSYVCGRLGRDLPHLKSLVFTPEGDFLQGSSINVGINMFSYLKRLELNLCFTHQINLLSLTPLLHSCPLLQEFHLV